MKRVEKLILKCDDCHSLLRIQYFLQERAIFAIKNWVLYENHSIFEIPTQGIKFQGNIPTCILNTPTSNMLRLKTQTWILLVLRPRIAKCQISSAVGARSDLSAFIQVVIANSCLLFLYRRSIFYFHCIISETNINKTINEVQIFHVKSDNDCIPLELFKIRIQMRNFSVFGKSG